MKRFVFPIILGITLFSCSHSKIHKTDANFTIIPVKLGTSLDTKISEIASSIEYIKLETKPECLIGNIARLYIFQNKFIIWDGKPKATIFFFNSNGRYLFKIQRSGKGPGEYIGVQDMFVDEQNGNIVVYDASQAKIIMFSIDGNFIKEIDNTLLPMAFSAKDDSSFWFYSMGFVRVPQLETQYNLLHVAKDGRTVLSYHFPFNPNTDDFFHKSFYNDNGYFLFNYSYCDTIYSINDSNIIPFIFIDFNKSRQLEELSRIDLRLAGERSRIIQSENFARLHEVMANDKLLFIRYANSSFQYKLMYSFLTKKLLHIRYLINDIDDVPLNLHPKKLKGSKLYLTVDPIDIIEYFARSKSSDEKDIPTFLNDIRIDDNPILAILKLKEF
jgi:hypothetical protein